MRFLHSYICFIYSIADLLFGAVPIVYEERRGWNTLQGSLPFLAVLLGTLVAAAINAMYSQFMFAPNVDKHGGKVPPEKRLPPMSTFCMLYHGDDNFNNYELNYI